MRTSTVIPETSQTSSITPAPISYRRWSLAPRLEPFWKDYIQILLTLFILISRSYGDAQVLLDTKEINLEQLDATGITDPYPPKSNSFREKNVRTFLDADHLNYNKKQKIITAFGNVRVSRGDITLLADKVIYNQRVDKINAHGNVRILDSQKNILFAQEFEIDGDMKKGFTNTVQGILADNSVFAANGIQRNSESESQFNQVTYTPCSLCRSDPSKHPTWAIQSRHMLINHEEGDIEHTDSFLQINGTRVLYIPYLSHPGPHVKRRSGFLSPFFGGSENLGAILGFSYYWAINNQSDVTFTPIYTRENPLLVTTYRHAFCNGAIEIETSITKGKFKSGPAESERNRNRLRGHIKTSGRLSVPVSFFDGSYFGFNIHRTLDGTYLKRYTMLGYAKESYLTSRLYYEGFRDRSYFLAEGFSFQGLQQDDRNKRIPFIAPSIEYHYLSKPMAYQFTPYVDTSILNIQRRQGQNTKRFSTTFGIKRQWISNFGTVSDIGAEAKIDAYGVSASRNPKTNGNNARITPRLFAHIKYPLYQVTSYGRFVLEPIVGIVITSNNRNTNRFPDEDSFIEMSDANIFDADRFSGLDIVDQWSRVNYGAKLSFYSKSLGNSELFLGQSIALTSVNPLVNHNLEVAGVRPGTSDFVVRAHYTYKDWVHFASRMVLNRDRISAKRNETQLSIGQKQLRFKIGYVRIPKPILITPALSSFSRLSSLKSIEQIKYGVSTQLNKTWRLSFHAARELGSGGGALSHGATLTYSDDCFDFSTTLTKTFYQDRDFKPGLTTMFRISFKNLGEVSISGDRLGLGKSLKE